MSTTFKIELEVALRECREAKDREWAATILHALDPHRGGYTQGALDRLRIKARNASGLSDKEAADVAAAVGGGGEA